MNAVPTVAECQEKITSIEAMFANLPSSLNNLNLVTQLRDYTVYADMIGVATDSGVLLRALRARGFLSISEMSDEQKRSMLNCIVGNFIHSHGSPPPNVMCRFSEDYIDIVRQALS